MAALALAAHGKSAAAEAQLQALASWQAADGSLGVTAEELHPNWPTTLAVIAWERASADLATFHKQSAAALRWLLQQRGETVAPVAGNIGHNTMLVGWPWVQGTHSWLEPTAFALLALKAAGQGTSPRAREAAELLTDRLLPDGGCNYGNTFILGQELRPHVQPTGLVMLALAGESTTDARIEASLRFLRRELLRQHSAASFSYALLGLAAHGQAPPQDTSISNRLQQLAETALVDRNALRLSLLLLAAQGAAAPLNPLAEHASHHSEQEQPAR